MIIFFYRVCQCGEEFGSYTAILLPAKGRQKGDTSSLW